jgi:hypothetical protein
MLAFLTTSNDWELVPESVLDASSSEFAIYVTKTDGEASDVDLVVRGRSRVTDDDGKLSPGEWFDVIGEQSVTAGDERRFAVPCYFDEVALFARSAVTDVAGGVRVISGLVRGNADLEAIQEAMSDVSEETGVSPLSISVSTDSQVGAVVPVSGLCSFDSDFAGGAGAPMLFAVIRIGTSGGAASDAEATIAVSGDTSDEFGNGTSFLVFSPASDGSFTLDVTDEAGDSGLEVEIVVGPWEPGVAGAIGSKGFTFSAGA